MLETLKHQLLAEDALTIVFDGSGALLSSGLNEIWMKEFVCSVNLVTQDPQLGSWGHGIRNLYQSKLTPQTKFLMNADDDDTYMADAFEKLRSLCVDKDTLYVAKMKRPHDIIPAKPSIEDGNIGTPCGIIPFKSAGMAEWGSKYGGDGEYYTQLKAHVKEVVFLDEVIYCVPS
jgi:hypothetical protein